MSPNQIIEDTKIRLGRKEREIEREREREREIFSRIRDGDRCVGNEIVERMAVLPLIVRTSDDFQVRTGVSRDSLSLAEM